MVSLARDSFDRQVLAEGFGLRLPV